jgi:hypothetical protein
MVDGGTCLMFTHVFDWLLWAVDGGFTLLVVVDG